VPRSTTSVTAPSRPRCIVLAQQPAATSAAEVEAAHRADLPQFDKDEFYAFLVRCAHAFPAALGVFAAGLVERIVVLAAQFRR
jgi:hypothetical protein